MVKKRALLLVVDGLGVGHMEDVITQRPQDLGANTLAHILEKLPELELPYLFSLGLANLLSCGAEVPVRGAYGKLNLQHQGADSYMGHQELMGTCPQKPVLEPFGSVIQEVQAGLHASGFRVEMPVPERPYLLVDNMVIVADNIETDFGQVYNVSAPLKEIEFEKVLEIGRLVRKLVRVSRVIALGGRITRDQLLASIEICPDGRVGVNSPRSGVYEAGYQVRHLGLGVDPSRQLPALLSATGCKISLIGKMQDVIEADNVQLAPAVQTQEVLALTEEHFRQMNCGLVAATVQETDLAGHAQDVEGYGRLLGLVDAFIGHFVQEMGQHDILFVTGDHGNDPTIGHSQHTREKTPLLVYGKTVKPGSIGERETLSDVAATLAEYFGCARPENGNSFLDQIDCINVSSP